MESACYWAEFLLGGDENILKFIVMFAYLHEQTKNHQIGHFTRQ